MRRACRSCVATLLLMLLLTLLVSCGFHLRGSQSLPAKLAPLYLEKDSMSLSMYRELRAALRSVEGQLTEDPTLAASTLKVVSERRVRNVTSVDSAGRAREYDLRYIVDFSLSAGSEVLIERDSIELNRTLLFNPDTVLGVAEEAENIYDDMIRDGAGLILLKAQAAGRR